MPNKKPNMQPVIDNLSNKLSGVHAFSEIFFEENLTQHHLRGLFIMSEIKIKYGEHYLKLFYRMIDNGFRPTKFEIRDIIENLEQILEEENAPKKRWIFNWIPFMNK